MKSAKHKSDFDPELIREIENDAEKEIKEARVELLSKEKSPQEIRQEFIGMSKNIVPTKSSQYNSEVYFDECSICQNKTEEIHHIIEQNKANDDGNIVEPIYYIPIIPMVLVNGAKGIGTGFSTEILCYNPLTIIEYLERKLLNIENNLLNCSSSNEEIKFIPFYQGFKGEILSIDENNIISNINIFPNPATQSARIKLNLLKNEYTRITLNSQLGQVINLISEGNLSIGENFVNVDLSNVKPGIYFVNVQTGNINTVQKLIVR
jgi:hypothetical protein